MIDASSRMNAPQAEISLRESSSLERPGKHPSAPLQLSVTSSCSEGEFSSIMNQFLHLCLCPLEPQSHLRFPRHCCRYGEMLGTFLLIFCLPIESSKSGLSTELGAADNALESDSSTALQTNIACRGFSCWQRIHLIVRPCAIFFLSFSALLNRPKGGFRFAEPGRRSTPENERIARQYLLDPVKSRELLQHCPRLTQIHSVETFGEPVVNAR